MLRMNSSTAAATERMRRVTRPWVWEKVVAVLPDAVAFALLGWLHLRGRAGTVLGATGARGPRVLGKRTPAGRDAEPPA